MKKRIQTLILVIAMAMSCNETSFAEKVVNEDIYEIEITEDMPDEGYVAIPKSSIDLTAFAEEVAIASIDQTFTMTSTHRGADRTYSSTTLYYTICVTDTSGNAVSDKVKVALYDYNSADPVSQNTITADGYYYSYNLTIVANRVYYFYYSKVSGTTGTLKIRMQIN